MFKKLIILGASILILGAISSYADVHPEFKDKQGEELQRTPTGLFDNQKNTVSNFEFYSSNYGIFGYNIANRVGGGYWPRNSRNQYVFAGGAWFAALKPRPGAGLDEDGNPIYKKYVAVSYDPRTGQSWFVPGRIRDKNDRPTFEADFNDIFKYRVYMSTDYDRSTGLPLDDTQPYNWPIWDSVEEDTVKFSRYFGLYEEDENRRNIETYPKGPAFISGEDIFASFKETDLNYNSKGYGTAKQEGYPLYVQIEHMIYSWGFGQYKDFVFLKYDFINMSPDILEQCWHAPIMDVDIARSPFVAAGARNDRVSWYTCDTTLNMAVQWTNDDQGERGFGFGYLGFDYLESPSINFYYALDENGERYLVRPRPDMPEPFYFNRDGDTLYPNEDTFDDTQYLRKTRRVYPVEEQLGLVTFENWSIEDDKITDEQRYDFMSSRNQQGDTGPGDKRFMMATGPYNMLPRDTARVVVGIILARTSKGGEAQGIDDCDDLAELDKIDRFAQEVYDNNFRAPIPPERPAFTEWTPLNNGIMVRWDNSAELSIDEEADGLDFLGYSLYRARKPELDTFAINEEAPSQEYPSGRGPFGWKRVADFSMPLAFAKSSIQTSGEGDEMLYPFIDSLRIVGPVVNRGQAEPQSEPYDLFSMHVMRVPRGTWVYDEATAFNLTQTSSVGDNRLRGKIIPIIANIDTAQVGFVMSSRGVIPNPKPWEKYFLNYAGGQSAFNTNRPNQPTLFYNYFENGDNNRLLEDIVVGQIELSRSLIPYNPMHYKTRNVRINQALLSYIEFLRTTPGAAQVINDKIIVRAKESRDSLVYTTKDSTYTDPATGEDVTVTVREYEWIPDPDNPGEFIQRRNSYLVEISKVDTVYHYSTLREQFGTNEASIDISIQRNEAEIMTDPENVQETLDSLYSWIQKGFVTYKWPTVNDTVTTETGGIELVDVPFQQSEYVRKTVITDHMDLITNGRSFIDIGDDDQDGRITSNEDPTNSEKLINNINYYYKLVPYDEGDYGKSVQMQSNTTPFSNVFQSITNITKAYPEATPVGPAPRIEIIEQTDDLLGGVSNVRFFALNNDRVKQLFAGDTLELTWEPLWFRSSYIPVGGRETDTIRYSLLARNIKLVNVSDNNKLLYQQVTQFEPNTCSFGLIGQLTENAGSYVLATPDSILVDSTSRQTVNGEDIYDVITMNQTNSLEYVQRRGSFTTGRMEVPNWCYLNGFTQEAYGILGFEYDYTVRQFGGIFRSHLIEKLGDAQNRSTVVSRIEQNRTFHPDRVHITQTVGFREQGRTPSVSNEQQVIIPRYEPINASFNNGAGDYLLEFTPGGTETRTFKYDGLPGSNQKEVTFELRYLNVKVTNNLEIYRYDETINDSVLIPTPKEIDYVELPVSGPRYQVNNSGQITTDYLMTPAWYPHPKNLTAVGRDPKEFIGKFTIYNVGWIGLRERGNMPSLLPQINRLYAFPTTFEFDEDNVQNYYPYSGLQGKYYLSATAQVDGQPLSIDFTHVVNIAGAQYVLDFANAGRLVPNTSADQRQFGNNNRPVADYPPLAEAIDFQVGDQLRMLNWGSAVGLPESGAKVRAVVRTEGENYKYTEDDLEGIGVVPNPYYVTHQSQRSVFDAQLFFTRLPKECTISIYTMGGDLVQTIEHKNAKDGERRAVEVWDLMSKNGFRTQSQVLVAVITTPNGESVTKTFSIVVGNFRIVD